VVSIAAACPAVYETLTNWKSIFTPPEKAIIPLMVPQEEYLKKATTLAGLSWSFFAAVGSSLGGLVLTLFGFQACFCKFVFTKMLWARRG
jgi:hypothetical protein